MTRQVLITSYEVSFATCSQGFNEWRKNIIVNTQDPATMCDIRFVDNPSSLPPEWEKVDENGISVVYLPSDQFPSLLEVLQTEKPLFLTLYAIGKHVLVQTGAEPPGEEAGV
jgi:hypothetical protein